METTQSVPKATDHYTVMHALRTINIAMLTLVRRDTILASDFTTQRGTASSLLFRVPDAFGTGVSQNF